MVSVTEEVVAVIHGFSEVGSINRHPRGHVGCEAHVVSTWEVRDRCVAGGEAVSDVAE